VAWLALVSAQGYSPTISVRLVPPAERRHIEMDAAFEPSATPTRKFSDVA
jgi:hypothetical protein